MFAVAYRNTQRSIERISAERAARLEQKRREEAKVVRLVHRQSALDKAIEEARQKREDAVRRANEAAERYKQELIEAGCYRHTLAMLEKRICRALGISKTLLRSNRRLRKVVFARQAFMYWAYRLTNRSLPEIGRYCGGRDHTTVLHAVLIYPRKRKAMGRHLKVVRYSDRRR